MKTPINSLRFNTQNQYCMITDKIKKYKTKEINSTLHNKFRYEVSRQYLQLQKHRKKQQEIHITLDQYNIVDLMFTTARKQLLVETFMSSMRELYLLCCHMNVPQTLQQQKQKIHELLQQVTLQSIYEHTNNLQEIFCNTYTLLRNIFNLTDDEIHIFILLMYHAGLHRHNRQEKLQEYILALFCNKQLEQVQTAQQQCAKTMLQKICSVHLQEECIQHTHNQNRPHIGDIKHMSHEQYIQAMQQTNEFVFTIVMSQDSHTQNQLVPSESKYHSIMKHKAHKLVKFYLTLRDKQIEKFTLNKHIVLTLLLNLSTLGETGLSKFPELDIE